LKEFLIQKFREQNEEDNDFIDEYLQNKIDTDAFETYYEGGNKKYKYLYILS